MNNLTDKIEIMFTWDHNFAHVGIQYKSEDPVLVINPYKDKNLRENLIALNGEFEWWKRPNYVPRFILSINAFEFMYIWTRENRLKAKVSNYDTNTLCNRLYFRQK